MSEKVKLQVRQDVKEYVAGVRAFFLRDYGIFKTLMGTCLMGAYIFFFLVLMNVSPLVALFPALLVLMTYTSAVLFSGPRKRFLRDPKLREGFEVEFSDEGILYGGPDMIARMNWNYYSRVVETEKVYVLVRGTLQMTVIPKRAFTSAAQEAAFRRLLARHLPAEGLKNLKGGTVERREIEEYVPPPTPPDWR
jgi:YcxB-like protein